MWRGFIFWRVSQVAFESQNKKPPHAQATSTNGTRMIEKILREPSVLGCKWRSWSSFGRSGRARGSGEWFFWPQFGRFCDESSPRASAICAPSARFWRFSEAATWWRGLIFGDFCKFFATPKKNVTTKPSYNNKRSAGGFRRFA